MVLECSDLPKCYRVTYTGGRSIKKVLGDDYFKITEENSNGKPIYKCEKHNRNLYLLLRHDYKWVIADDKNGTNIFAQLDTKTEQNPEKSVYMWKTKENYVINPPGNVYLKVKAECEGISSRMGGDRREEEYEDRKDDENDDTISAYEEQQSYLPIYIGGGIALLEIVICGTLAFMIIKYPMSKISSLLGDFV